MAFNSLSDLRKSRGGFDTLMKEVDKISQPAGGERKEDDRFWQPTVDKAGNGYAVVRFLGYVSGIMAFKVLLASGTLRIA
jgi:hypothetical protein